MKHHINKHNYTVNRKVKCRNYSIYHVEHGMYSENYEVRGRKAKEQTIQLHPGELFSKGKKELP